MRLMQYLLGIFFSVSAIGFPFFHHKTYDITPEKALVLDKSDLSGKTKYLNNDVLHKALTAYACARKKGLDNKELLTVIDYSIPGTRPRLWVIDLKHLHVKYNELVAHGERSGGMVATRFSNVDGSHESSVGTYLTANAYYGHDGYALRLKGLEPGYNDHAYSRAIVMHGAAYVSAGRIIKYGHIGVSFGCPAIPKKMVMPTINMIKNGTLLFAYGNDQDWLKHSKYLHC